MDKIFSSSATNFLSLTTVSGFELVRGDNNLDTCYQYAVKGDEGTKLLVVKIYDKLLDLLAREGSHLVGSRVATILGSKWQLSLLEKRVRRAQHTGMTRLEVSICPAALVKYAPHQPSVKTKWHSKMQAAMDLLVHDVLNNKEVIQLVYRKLSLPTLLGLLGHCSNNLMVIGTRNTWMINARTCHRRHFIGTKQVINMDFKKGKLYLLKKLKTFALRYAASGSIVKVFSLHQHNNK